MKYFFRLAVVVFSAALSFVMAAEEGVSSAPVVSTLAPLPSPEPILASLGGVRESALTRQLCNGAGSHSVNDIVLIFRRELLARAEVALRAKDKKFSPEFVHAATGHEFFRRIRVEDYKRFNAAGKRKEAAEFFRWVHQNPEVMFHFNALGPVSGDQTTWFYDWFALWRLYPSSRTGLGQKAALILAHLNATNTIFQEPPVMGKTNRRNCRHPRPSRPQNTNPENTPLPAHPRKVDAGVLPP